MENKKTITIILRDYQGNPTTVEIPADCDHIEGKIISGDMVMEKPFYVDSSNTRHQHFYDGCFYISKHNFERMNEMTDAYSIQQILD